MLEDDRVVERIVRAFETGYPHLSMKLSWRERARPLGVWKATVRVKDGGQMVSTGVRRHQALAVGAALEGIPERLRRLPRV